MSKVLDRVQSATEYLISAAFILSAIALVGHDPLEGSGFIVAIFGGHVALFIYMVWFFILGFWLIFAKVKRHRKMHKNALLAIYLTCIYTSILTFYLIGFGGIIDDMTIGVLSAVFWVRWKFKTEYLLPGETYSEIFASDHLDDTPGI